MSYLLNQVQGFGWILPLLIGVFGTLGVEWFLDKRRSKALRRFAENLFWIQTASVPFSPAGEHAGRPVYARTYHITAVDILLQNGVLGATQADLQLMQALAELKRSQEQHNQLVVLAMEYSLQLNKNEEYFEQYREQINWAHNRFREAIVWVKAVMPSSHSSLWPTPDWPDDYAPSHDERKPNLTYAKTKREGRFFEPPKRSWRWKKLPQHIKRSSHSL